MEAVPPAVISLSYEEPEQMADVLSLPDLDVLVLSGANRPWKHVTVPLGGLVLDWGDSPCTILAHGAVASAACFNYATAAPGESIVWNGRAVERNHVIASTPGTEFTAAVGRSTHVALFATPDRWTETLGPLLGTDDWTMQPGCSVIRAEPEAMDRLRRVVQVALEVCDTLPELLRHDEARRGMEQSFSAALAEIVRSGRTDRPRSNVMRTHGEIIRQAEEFIRQRVGAPIYIGDLCAATRVSERTLRTAFYDIYRTSPTRYLHVRRLHQARRALRQADAARTTVTVIAGRCGFWELGRFAGAYRALFGETPSQTLYGTAHRGAT